MSSTKVKRQHSPALVASYAAAMKLGTLGMAVTVERPNGQLEPGTLAALPYTLGTGEWVAEVKVLVGDPVTRSTTRIRPVQTPVPTRR